MTRAVGRGVSRRAMLYGLGSALLPAAIGMPLVRPAGAEALAPAAAEPKLPPAPRDGTSYTLHGVTIADPFRPLEDASRADVRAWIDALDTTARAALNDDPLHAKVLEFLRVKRARQPEPLTWRNGRYFRMAYDNGGEQPRLEVRDRPNDPPRTLIDPATFNSDGTTSLAGWYLDRTASKVAYLTADAGGDMTVLRIRDVRTGVDLNDRLEGCRFTSVAWLPSGTGFYYARPPLPGEPVAWHRKSHAVFYHQLGYPQASDTRVFSFDLPNAFISLSVSTVTNQLFISAGIGTDGKRGLWIAPIENAALAIRVLPLGRYGFSLIGSVGARLYAITDLDAARGRIVRVELGAPWPEDWKTLVPEGPGVIDGVRIVGSRLVVRTFQDLGHRLAIHDLDGIKRHDVRIEEHAAVTLGSVEQQAPEMYVTTSTHLHPGRLYKLAFLTGAIEPVPPGQSPPSEDRSDITVRFDSCVAPDGTRVPITIMHRRDAIFSGEARTLLYAYGGFGRAQWPQFNRMAAAWVRLGGVYAIAHIRGGGENGGNWHDQARARNRQVGFDDFHAAARFLVEAGITRPDRLGIYGASNGGLLVLAAMLQKPELYGAVVSGVPVTDMFRFHHHTFGIAWKPEYGDPEVEADFQALRTYSPLHAIKAGTAYPPLLMLTADNDQRVVPSHTYKFAAALREAVPNVEVLVRTRRAAGHGPGNASSRRIEYQADIITFLTNRLGGSVIDLPRA